MIKMVADYLGPPLADVINTCNKNIGLEARAQLATPKGTNLTDPRKTYDLYQYYLYSQRCMQG